MRQNTDEQLAAWSDTTWNQGFERRQWRLGQKLATICVLLLLAGLLVNLGFEGTKLTALFQIGAVISGVAMMVFFYDQRLFVERPSNQR